MSFENLHQLETMILLSRSSAKIDKSNKFDEKYLTKILYLAPAKLSGYQMCPAASEGCKAACLNTAGMGVYSSVQEARKKRTILLMENRRAFLEQIFFEISNAEKLAKSKGKTLVARLNGTSDFSWETTTNIIQSFPNVIFYDYTKVFSRMVKFLTGNMPANYHLTFSLSENNLEKCEKVLAMGGNIAAVFRRFDMSVPKTLPNAFLGYRVLDGDSHDLRFTEGTQGVIVGLWAKGKAKKDDKEFCIWVC